MERCATVPVTALRVLAVLAGVGVFVVAGGWLLQDWLIYLPSGTPGSPAEAGLPDAEELTVPTEDGLARAAWFVPAAAHTPAGAVLVLPGNAGNRSLRAPLAIRLAGAGLDVLLVDYRGFGDNPGRPSREGLLADARAARVALRERSAADAVVYYGESLGGAVTVALAGEQAPDALVLRSPFTSLTDVGRLHYPFLPVALLRDRFAVEEDIRSYAGPVLVVAGERDRIIPPAQSRRVAEAAPGSAKYVEVPGADHNDAALLAGDRLIEAVVTFLARVGIDAAL